MPAENRGPAMNTWFKIYHSKSILSVMVRVTTEDGSTIRSHPAKGYDDRRYGPIRNWTRGSYVSRGGMGEMFVGKNVDNGQMFLIKSVAREPVWSKQLIALENEEKILRKLSKKKCPNIFRTVGNATSESVAEMGGKPTMDLFFEFAMPRGNLTEIIKRTEKLSESVAKAYTYQLLQALSCMHRNGIVHCGIKSTCIVLCERGVKLVGFGLAKEVRPHPPAPHETCQTDRQLVTSQASMDPTPECIEDIAALGLVVCEMVTGRRPVIDHSSPMEKVIPQVIRSLEEEFDLKKSMPDCMSFIQSCLWMPRTGSSDNEASTTFQEWTADRLLHHPWMSSLNSFRPSDLSTSDEDSIPLTSPFLSMMTDGNTPAVAEDSPRVMALKKCAAKLCCRKMDTDAVVPPLSARSFHTPRKGHKLTRVL